MQSYDRILRIICKTDLSFININIYVIDYYKNKIYT